MKTTITLNQIFRNFFRLQRSCWSAVFFLTFLLSATSSWGQVTTLQNWSNLYQNTSTSSQTVAYSIPAGSGTNKVLAVAIASSQDAVGARTVSIAYGGQAMTLASGNMATTTTRQHTAIYYLNEAGIDAATNTNLVFTVSGGTTRVTTVWAAVFDYVDQTSPITNSQNYNSIASNASSDTFVFSSNLTINNRDQAVLVLSSLRSGSTSFRSISTLPTSFTSVNEQTWGTGDGVRNAILNRSVPTSNTSSNCSTVMSNSSRGSMTGVSFKGCAAPTVNAGSALANICIGGTSAGLGGSKGGSATGGTWSSSVAGGSFSPDATTLNATYTPPSTYTGTVTLTLTSSGGSCGTATASKTLTVTAPNSATISYAGTPFCRSLTAGQAVTLTGTTGGTYSSTTGLTISSSTGAITPSTSTAGTYTVTYTMAAAGGCSAQTATTSVTITTLPAATISYVGSPFCNSNSTAQSVTFTGTSGGTYSSTAGLTINSSTGAINPSTSTAGTYTVTYTMAAGGGCTAQTATTSVTINAAASATISYTASAFCKSVATAQSVTLTGTAGGTYSASPAGLIINASTGAITPSTSTAGTYTVTYSVTPGGCSTATTTTSVTISNNPTASISGTTTACGSVTLTASGGTSYLWSSGSSTATAANSFTASGTYTVTVTNDNGCTNTASQEVTVNPIPTSVTATPSETAICIGDSINLTSSATSNSTTATTVLSQNFNGTPTGWTTTNTSTGGTIANAAWTLRPNGHVVCNTCSTTETLNSNDASQFYLSNSDAQGNGGTTATTLRSPSFSTQGMSSASLTFYQYYRDFNTSDSAIVEISTNGTSWTVLNTYTSLQGTRNGFSLVTTSLNTYLGQATVFIRFRYAAVWGYYWAIDNVTVSGTLSSPPAATFAWTSTPAGFTSSTQNPTGVTPTVATTYTVTATNSYGCTASATTSSVAVNALPTVTSATGNSKTYTGIANATTVSAVASAEATIDWYDASTGGTLLASGTLTYAPEGINVGTYTVYAQARNTTAGCTSTARTSATLTINVATPTVTVTVGTYTYNASAQGPTAATNTGTGSSYTFSYVGTGSTTYAASSTLPTAAGTYTATATVAANGNFGSASSSATAFTIDVATPTVTVTVGTYTYNASAQGPTAATNTGTGSSYTFSYVGTGSTTYAASSTLPTAAGTYTATATVAANGDFGSASSGATSFSIATKDLTITANNATKCFGETYTLENTAFTSSGLQNGETIGSVTLTSSGVSSDAAAASYSIVPSEATGGTFTAGNYSINYVNGSLVVNPVSVGGTIAGGATVCFGTNSTELTLSGHTGSVTRWESSLDDFATSGTPIANTTETLTATNLAATTSYRAVVTSGACAAANSATATVTVTPASVAPTSATASVTTMCGSGSATLTLTGGGGQGATIKWYTSSCGGTLVGTGNNLEVSPTNTTTYYGRYEGSCDVTSCASVTITFISATTTTWNGTTWSNGAPTASTAAIISGTFTSPGTDPNWNLRACKLTVNAGATVLIKSGDSVTLDGALIAASGSFVTFNSGANLIQYGTTNENTGAIVIKRESAKIRRLDYSLWSSPVAAQGLQAFSPNTLSNRFYSYNSSTNLYQAVDPSATNFSPFNGYLIRTANTHPTTPASWTGQFTGVPNNGNYSMAFTGYRVIGNPYPSAIDAENFIDTNIANGSITGTVYFWRKTNGSSNAAYCTYNLGGFVSNNDSAISNMTVNPNTSTNVVQVGQGFIVEGTGTSNVVFTNDMRIDSNVNRFLRVANTIERNRIWLNITNAAGSFSQAMIAYMTGATQGVDPSIDGKLLTDGDVSLASLIETTSYAIQGRALPFDMTDVVPMSFKVTTAGDYTITIDHVDGLFSNGAQTVYLRDNTIGVVHNLSTGAYTFTSASGTFDTRFEIIYQSTSLAVSTPTFNESQVVIYKTPTNEISINTGNVVMSKVKIFDIRGRLLQEKKDINASQTLMNAGLTTEVLLVQITSEEGIVVTKKVLFPRTSLKLDKKIEVKTQLAEDE